MSDARPRRPVAVLGASGYIGQSFLARLADHPDFEPALLVAGPRRAGRRLEEVWMLPEPPPPELAGRRLVRAGPAAVVASGAALAFSGLPSGSAGPMEREIVRRGIPVFTNAADLRTAPGTTLLIPEVNPEHWAGTHRNRTAAVVANPNCSATGLALALAPILPLLRPRSIHVSTYQSLSGAGFPGVPSLSIVDNVVPFIEQEEEKIARETARLLGARRGSRLRSLDVPILAHAARVATREGHLEAVTVEAGRRPTRAEIRAAWAGFDPLRELALPSAPHPPVEVRGELDRPQPLRDRWAGAPVRARGMAVSVGRVRWEAPFLRFFLLVHNTVRGGAGGSILNAEFVRARGGLPP